MSSSTAAEAAGDGRQVITASQAPHQRKRPLGGCRAAVDEGRDKPAVEIVHREVEPVAQQAARQLAADIPEPDKSDFHVHVPRTF